MIEQIFTQPILWTLGVIIIAFTMCFAILYLSKPDFVSYKNSKGKKILDYGKLSLVSLIISIFLGIAVFLYSFNKDKSNYKFPVTSSQPPQVFKRKEEEVITSNWVTPI